jgi:NADPH-dependent curcumin reductase CurA
MSEKGLILSCGAMSLLDGAESNYALKNWGMVQRKALTIQGFNVMQWASEFPTAVQELRGMLAEGRLLAHETVLTGFDQVVEGLLGLFRGDNTGKMIISLERD